MADYLEAYAARFDLPVRRGTRVDAIARNADRLVIIANDHRFEADNVVLATGGYRAPYRPDFADELDAGIMQLHSSEYRTPSQLHDGDVLVGAPQTRARRSLSRPPLRIERGFGSAPGTSQPAQEAGSTGYSPRPSGSPLSRVASVTNPIGRRMRPGSLKMTVPLGRVRLKDLEAAGVGRLPRTIAVRDRRPVMDDGQIADVANIVWATGYRPAVDWVHIDVFD